MEESTRFYDMGYAPRGRYRSLGRYDRGGRLGAEERESITVTLERAKRSDRVLRFYRYIAFRSRMTKGRDKK